MYWCDFFISASEIFKNFMDYVFFFYKNFSLSWLILIIVFVFRKDISNILKGVRQINFSNNSGEVSVLITKMYDLKDEMENSESFQIREYGEDLRDKGQFGKGPNSDKESDFHYYFDLINLSGALNKELAKYGIFEVIKKLYDAYNYLTEDKVAEDDKPTKIIREVYRTAVDIKENGGYLLDESLVYKYRDFIKLSYRGLENRNHKK